MSAHLRNFWITTKNDNSPTIHATGPKGALEGFRTEIRVAALGESKVALTIDGFAKADGTLKLVIRDADGYDMEFEFKKK